MFNQTVIDALESCKEILINELYKELKETPGHRVEINVLIVGEQDYYSDNYTTNTITAVYLGEKDEHDVVMVDYESFEEEFRDPIELFKIGEIADVIDAL